MALFSLSQIAFHAAMFAFAKTEFIVAFSDAH